MLVKIAKKCCRLFFESKKLYICDKITPKALFALTKRLKRPDKGHDCCFTVRLYDKNHVLICYKY